ncbi:hypothetical protein BH10BDE1_BH10BDE1_22910 [soil metagenome]
MKFFFVVLVSALSLGSIAAHADSSCWPEEKLVGTLASSFIEGINTQLKRTDSGTCDTTVYAEPSSSSKSRIVACRLMTCANGECGDGGEYTALAVIERRGPFSKIEMKDGSTAWFKVAGEPNARDILFAGSEGTLFPTSSQVLDAPGGAVLKFKVKDGTQVAYTVKKLVKKPSRAKGHEKMVGEIWAEVDARPIESAEPPVKLGSTIGHGFFLYRTAEGKVAAVLSAVYCD